MADLTAQRTLVKSPPELWTELSDVAGLAKYLGELGEIRITRVEPETTVAWEGDQISGTVELEQSGWGTKVTFQATVPEPDAPGPAATDRVSTEPVGPGSIEADDAGPGSIEADDAETVDQEPTGAQAEASPAASEADPAERAEPDPVDLGATTPAEASVESSSGLSQEATAGDPVDPADRPRRGFISRWLFRQRSPQPANGAVEAEAAVELAAAAPPVEAAEPIAAAEAEVGVEPTEPVEAEAATEPAPPTEAEAVAVAAEPTAEEPEAATATLDADRVRNVFEGTLEALGQAHHRPFSRG